MWWDSKLHQPSQIKPREISPMKTEELMNTNQYDAATELLTVNDVAAFLRVPKSWVYERTRRRGAERLPHVKLGKYLRFRLSEVAAYLEKLRRG